MSPILFKITCEGVKMWNLQNIHSYTVFGSLFVNYQSHRKNLILLRVTLFVGSLEFWKIWNLFSPFRDLDPAPNPPYFPSHVVKATLDYIGSCYKTKSKELVAILSKNPVSNWNSALWQCDDSTLYHLRWFHAVL